MKLYYSKGACSLTARIILNELNLPFNAESVNLKTKKTEIGEDFLSINPKGSVPVLVLDNDEILTENAVILQYLAETTKATVLLPSIGDFKRYRVLEWLNYITTEMHKTVGTLFNSSITEAMKNEIYLPMIKNKLDYINRQLDGKDYLLGEHLSLPDAYLFVILRWLYFFKIDLAQWPHLQHFFQIMNARPSVMESLKQET